MTAADPRDAGAPDRRSGFAEAPATFLRPASVGSAGAYPSLFDELGAFAAAAADDAAWSDERRRRAAVDRFCAATDGARLAALDFATSGVPIAAAIEADGASLIVLDADERVIAFSASAAHRVDLVVGERPASLFCDEALGVARLSDKSSRPVTTRIGTTGLEDMPQARRFLVFDGQNLSGRTRAILAGLYRLAPGELDVLDASLRRRTVAEAAADRDRSPETIRTQHSRILRKFGADSILDATLAAAAIEAGGGFDPETAASIRQPPQAPAYLAAGPAARPGGGPLYLKCNAAAPHGLVFLAPSFFHAPPSEEFVRVANKRGFGVFAPTPATALDQMTQDDGSVDSLASCIARAGQDCLVIASEADADLAHMAAAKARRRCRIVLYPDEFARNRLAGLARGAALGDAVATRVADAIAIAPRAAPLSAYRAFAFADPLAALRPSEAFNEAAAHAAAALARMSRAQRLGAIAGGGDAAKPSRGRSMTAPYAAAIQGPEAFLADAVRCAG